MESYYAGPLSQHHTILFGTCLRHRIIYHDHLLAFTRFSSSSDSLLYQNSDHVDPSYFKSSSHSPSVIYASLLSSLFSVLFSPFSFLCFLLCFIRSLFFLFPVFFFLLSLSHPTAHYLTCYTNNYHTFNVDPRGRGLVPLNPTSIGLHAKHDAVSDVPPTISFLSVTS